MNKELIEPLEFFKIDKISDDVYVIAQNVILRFNVSLSKISNGKRYHFHKEYEYSPKNKTDQQSLVTIKRSFDYYLSIENMQKDNNGNKLFIRIGPQEYMLFKRALETAISWFTDQKYKNLFAIDRGKLILTTVDAKCSISNLPMNKYMELYPTIIDHGISNADKEPGIEILFGDPQTTVQINLDRLMGLYYLISGFNMYQSAITVLNYLGRPEFGTNRFVMESGNYYTNKEEFCGNSGIEGRFVTPQADKNNIKILEGKL